MQETSVYAKLKPCISEFFVIYLDFEFASVNMQSGMTLS